MSRRSGLSTKLAPFILLGSLGIPAAHADVNGPTGSFNESVPVVAPAFRSLTPDLSLSYDSSDDNGRAGVGWDIDDASEIERATPGRGAPQYDANDIYVLDGQELVPCAVGSVSPSCSSGGTHSTKIEDYRKITFFGAGSASRWTVIAKNGVKSIYAPVYVAQLGADATWGTADDVNFRWGLIQVVDTKGNIVNYNWTTNQASTAEYLASVTYNGTTITLYYETRPDALKVATGASTLGTVSNRLKTIDVATSGSRIRAYKLGYTTSSATSRSLLTSVQQFGKDATVDGTGTITAGTTLPARTFSYQGSATSIVQGASDTALTYSVNSKFLPMDVDGDGKSDMVELFPNGPFPTAFGRRTWLSTGTGFTAASTVNDGIQYLANNAADQTVRFLTGDINGDGKSDFIEIYHVNCGFCGWGRRTWISNGTGFALGVDDALDGGYSKNSRFLALDANGDGKIDMIEVNSNLVLWLSNGTTGFTRSATIGGLVTGTGVQFMPADINGDGRTDIVRFNPTIGNAGARQIWMSTGTTFVAGATDTNVAGGATMRYLPMDLNADGKTDMVQLQPLSFTYLRRAWLSTGYGFVETAVQDGSSMSRNAASQELTIDVNGDGRDDLVAFNGSGTQTWLSTGTDFVAGPTTATIPTDVNTRNLPMDADGDGLTEIVSVKSSSSRTIWRIPGPFPDLMSSATTGFGGTTTVTYAPVSVATNAYAPPNGTGESILFPAPAGRAILQTAGTVTVNDGRGSAFTTSNTFTGAGYDPLDRRSLGFRYRKEMMPCIAGEATCPYTETWFRQDAPAAMSVERIDSRTGSGTLLASTVNEYTTNGAVIPRTSVQSGSWSYTYINAGTACPGADCKRSYSSRSFNAYGEITQQTEHGNWDVVGDERTAVTAFVPNTTAYIVNKPSDVKTYQGVGAAGSLLAETLSYYDGATLASQAPSAGLPTKTGVWLSSPSSFVESSTEYDSWGNITAVVNPLAARTTAAFDTTYHVFPVTTTNAVTQPSTAVWDAVCGQPSQQTNINGQLTTLSYDNLCRLVSKTAPGGKVETYSWSNLGNAATQYAQIDRPAADGTANALWSRNYFDGYQRTYRAAQKGPNAATGDIYVDTAYNARGSVASTTAPYYWVSGQPQPTTYITTSSYDALDRATRVTFPDAAFTATSYALWSTTNTDELGRATTDRFDADGRRVAHDETVAGVIKTAVYLYDPRGNLSQTTDPTGNITTRTTDSLGRTTQMVDLDWGTSTYEYDGAGRLTAAVDAKTQRTTFGYDALDRKTSKTSKAGTGQAATVSWTYDQVRAGFYNKGAVTTLTDAAGTKTLDYDVAGRLVKAVRTISGTGYTFQYGYDAGDRSLWTTYPDGDTLGTAGSPLTYDSAGRLKSIPAYVTSAVYGADGALTQVNNANGTVTTRPHSAQRGWLTGVSTLSGATTIQNLVYTRNNKGLITAVTSPIANEGWTYTKDELDRLTVATNTSSATYNQTVGYDAIGNITSNNRLGAYAYHATKKHAVVTAGANTYAYDAAGMMTSGTGRTITWTGDNQVATVLSGGVTSMMTYDADGARIQQVEGSTTRRYLGDDYQINVGSTVSKYISIFGVPVARKDATNLYWVHADNLGSIQVETNAAGAEVHRKKYRPFGEILSTSGTLPYEPRGFTAQRHDASGLVYLHGRYYDPVLARFISPDPNIDGTDTVGLNRYAYVANNPVDKTDVDGFSASVKSSFKADPNDRYHGKGIDRVRFSAQTVVVRDVGGHRVVTTNNTATAQIRSMRDVRGGTLLRTQHSTHYFAPPPPPPPTAVQAGGLSARYASAPASRQASTPGAAPRAPAEVPPCIGDCWDYRSLTYNPYYANLYPKNLGYMSYDAYYGVDTHSNDVTVTVVPGPKIALAGAHRDCYDDLMSVYRDVDEGNDFLDAQTVFNMCGEMHGYDD